MNTTSANIEWVRNVLQDAIEDGRVEDASIIREWLHELEIQEAAESTLTASAIV